MEKRPTIKDLTNYETEKSMTVYIVYEDCGCDETRNVACLETEEKAKRFCYKRNTSRPYRFHYEEWEVGEVLEGV